MIDGRSYRIFICFAHRNIEQLLTVVGHLRDLGHAPRWSGMLQAGSPFSPQIKEEIARSHLFVPILTPSSGRRPWVNQEIGFALASNVPVMPLALGNLPDGLAHELQAVQVQPDLSDVAQALTCERIESAVSLMCRRGSAMFELAPLVEDRTRMIFNAAEWISGVGASARVRQWGAFTSFSLPDAEYHDPCWMNCDGCEPDCNRGLRRDWRRERQAMERLARSGGCDLLIDPWLIDDPDQRRARATTLIAFFESMSDHLVRAFVFPAAKRHARGNLLVLGDWFLAESVTPLPGLGYERTLGTWHAPTVLSRVADFDRLMKRTLCENGIDPAQSRQAAIDALRPFTA